jgi:2-Cys peroxiredoxin 5
MAAYEVGDRAPDVTLAQMSFGELRMVRLQALLAGQRAIIIGIPGAFTPVCTQRHIPDFVLNSETFRQKGFGVIACVTPNDPWTNEAWSRVVDPQGKITFLSDGNLDLARALRVTTTERELFIGERSTRYMLLTRNAMVERLVIEPQVNMLSCTRSEDVFLDV